MRPKTSEAYARYLYGMVADPNKVELMNERQIVECRVRAFMDGVNWQKRQFRKQNGHVPRRRARNAKADA